MDGTHNLWHSRLTITSLMQLSHWLDLQISLFCRYNMVIFWFWWSSGILFNWLSYRYNTDRFLHMDNSSLCKNKLKIIWIPTILHLPHINIIFWYYFTFYPVYILRVFSPLIHIILIPSQPIFALTPYCCLYSGKAANTNFIVCGLKCVWVERHVYPQTVVSVSLHYILRVLV
jgi:hypothetical protein